MYDKFYYIGNFPPPYGGVTIKNELIFTSLKSNCDVTRSSVKTKIVREILDVVKCVINRSSFIIGLSARRKKSQIISIILYLTNSSSMRNSLYFMMGGVEADQISQSKMLTKVFKNYYKIYVETRSMKYVLEEVGLNNVGYFPNCRESSLYHSDFIKDTTKRLKCVFFSQIDRKKGVVDILKVARKIKEVDFVFYGNIEEKFASSFFEMINGIDNVKYMGVFQGTRQECYRLLSKYDTLLFPTYYMSEGVPGILIEAKMVGLAIIASDSSHNCELIHDELDGLIISNNDISSLYDAIKRIDDDRDLLNTLKKGSLVSSKEYSLNHYVEVVMHDIKVKNGGD